MKIKVTKTGLYGASGAIPVGEEFAVKEIPVAWKGKCEVISGEVEKVAVINPAQDDTAPAYEARDKENGWWGIFDAEGNEIGSLRKDDALAFNEMSDEDKAAYVAEASD